jgi:hypothetical protein
VLSAFGALVGLALAVIGTRAIAHQSTLNCALLAGVQLGFGVLAFTDVIAVLTGLILAPYPRFRFLEPPCTIH